MIFDCSFGIFNQPLKHPNQRMRAGLTRDRGSIKLFHRRQINSYMPFSLFNILPPDRTISQPSNTGSIQGVFHSAQPTPLKPTRPVIFRSIMSSFGGQGTLLAPSTGTDLAKRQITLFVFEESGQMMTLTVAS